MRIQIPHLPVLYSYMEYFLDGRRENDKVRDHSKDSNHWDSASPPLHSPLQQISLVFRAKYPNLYSVDVDIVGREGYKFNDVSKLFGSKIDSKKLIWDPSFDDGVGYLYTPEEPYLPTIAINDFHFNHKLHARTIGMGDYGAEPLELTDLITFESQVMFFQSVVNNYISCCVGDMKDVRHHTKKVAFLDCT